MCPTWRRGQGELSLERSLLTELLNINLVHFCNAGWSEERKIIWIKRFPTGGCWRQFSGTFKNPVSEVNWLRGRWGWGWKRWMDVDGWTEEGCRKESREEGRVVSSLLDGIHTSDPGASISAQRTRGKHWLELHGAKQAVLSWNKEGGSVNTTVRGCHVIPVRREAARKRCSVCPTNNRRSSVSGLTGSGFKQLQETET